MLNDPVNGVDPEGLSYAEDYARIGAAAGVALTGAASVVADVGTAGVNIAATPAELAVGGAIGAAIGYAVGSVLDDISYMKGGKGERNWEKARWDDPFGQKSVEDLKEIERTSPDPNERERAKKIRKQKQKKQKGCQ